MSVASASCVSPGVSRKGPRPAVSPPAAAAVLPTPQSAGRRTDLLQAVLFLLRDARVRRNVAGEALREIVDNGHADAAARPARPQGVVRRQLGQQARSVAAAVPDAAAAAAAHRLRSRAGSSMSMAMTPMRCMWSAMDSGPRIPFSTQPVRLVVLSRVHRWRNSITPSAPGRPVNAVDGAAMAEDDADDDDVGGDEGDEEEQEQEEWRPKCPCTSCMGVVGVGRRRRPSSLALSPMVYSSI